MNFGKSLLKQEQVIFSLGRSFAMNKGLQHEEIGQSAVDATEAFLAAVQVDVRADFTCKVAVEQSLQHGDERDRAPVRWILLVPFLGYQNGTGSSPGSRENVS